MSTESTHDDALRDALVRYGLPTTAGVDVLIRHIEANRKLAHEADAQTIDKLAEAIDTLFGWMDAQQTRSLEQEEPEVYELCQWVHHDLWHSTTHEQRMMRRG